MPLYTDTGLTRDEIRKDALALREQLQLQDKLYFPVVEVFELLPEIFPEINLEIVPDTELAPCHADTDLNNKTIRIAESIYEGACAGNGRDRMTICHEIGHYLYHIRQGIKVHRSYEKDVEYPPYLDPEWQAKCFAGELLIPKHLVSGMNIYDVMSKCGVSYAAAAYQIKK